MVSRKAWVWGSSKFKIQVQHLGMKHSGTIWVLRLFQFAHKSSNVKIKTILFS